MTRTDGGDGPFRDRETRREADGERSGQAASGAAPAGARMAAAGAAPIKVLTVCPEWPSRGRPGPGAAIEARMRAVQALGGCRVRVVAPTAWTTAPRSSFGADDRAPRLEKRAQIVVHRPRFFDPPLGSETLRARAIALTLNQAFPRLDRRGPFAVVDAHDLFPTGLAAARLAAKIGAPLVLSAYRLDAERLRADPTLRRQTLEAVLRSAATLCWSREIAEALTEMGAATEKLAIAPSGVDLARFRPASDRPRLRELRARLQAPPGAPLIVGFGPLTLNAGWEAAVDAIAAHPTAHLRLIGPGSAGPALETRAARAGALGRVKALGEKSPRETPELLAAADACIVAAPDVSARDAALESLACGTPVVALHGAAALDALEAPSAVRRAARDDSGAVSDALHRTLQHREPRDVVRRAALPFDVRRTAEIVDETLRRAASEA
ncbi:MAG: glycosyltransferase [Pseudomonadota bacterium]